MEYVFNWLVLLLSLGAVVLVALVCYADMVRSASRVPEAPVHTGEPSVQAVAPEAETAQAGPFVELAYRRNDAVEHVQRIRAGQVGYIGTETYPGLGPGMPVRHVEVSWHDGQFRLVNLDWQSPVRLRDESGAESEAAVGEQLALSDGCELLLPGGWTISCAITEDAGA